MGNILRETASLGFFKHSVSGIASEVETAEGADAWVLSCLEYFDPLVVELIFLRLLLVSVLLFEFL